jgi:hypothetical protein
VPSDEDEWSSPDDKIPLEETPDIPSEVEVSDALPPSSYDFE